MTALDAMPLEFFSAKNLLPATFEIAVMLDRTVYDSLYLALALTQECALITADKRFHSVVEHSALADHVVWIEDVL